MPNLAFIPFCIYNVFTTNLLSDMIDLSNDRGDNLHVAEVLFSR